MKEYLSQDLRNFTVVGHGDSGKTVLCEAMLANARVINRMGSIEAGNTVSDYHPDEQERKISIHATPMYLEWAEKKFNFIDAPGYLDFVGEALGALAVSDLAVIVIHATHGIEVGTEQMWNYASKKNIPKILTINAFDKEHTKFDEIVATAKDRFGRSVFPLQIPVNAGPGFTQVADVAVKRASTIPVLCWLSDDTGSIRRIVPISIMVTKLAASRRVGFRTNG